MTDLRKAAEMALEALDCIYSPLHIREINKVGAAMAALRQALTQPEQGNSNPNYPNTALNTSFVDAVNISQERVDEMAKREHEPVAFVTGYFGGHLTISCFDTALVLPDGLALYTAPPKAAEWVGLTDFDKQEAFDETQEASGGFWEFADYLEAKLKEKNT